MREFVSNEKGKIMKKTTLLCAVLACIVLSATACTSRTSFAVVGYGAGVDVTAHEDLRMPSIDITANRTEIETGLVTVGVDVSAGAEEGSKDIFEFSHKTSLTEGTE